MLLKPSVDRHLRKMKWLSFNRMLTNCEPRDQKERNFWDDLLIAQKEAKIKWMPLNRRERRAQFSMLIKTIRRLSK